jgi:hypothetical protein
MFATKNVPVFLPVSSEKGRFLLNFAPVSALDRLGGTYKLFVINRQIWGDDL